MLAKLPVELWTIILKPDYAVKFTVDIVGNGLATRSANQNLMHPNSPAYLQIRLVCQLFHDIITPHAFRHVVVQDEEYSLERLRNIAGTPGVAHHVKAYTFEFKPQHSIRSVREHMPHTPVDVYTQFLALDDDDQAEHLARLPEPQRRSLLRVAQIHRYFSSGALSREQVDYLASLPNLQSLSLQTCNVPLNVVMARSGTQTTKHVGCGADVLRALLEACYRRTLLPREYTRIEKLSMEGLDRDCLLASPQFIQQACQGMASIKHASFTIGLAAFGSRLDLHWVKVLGKLLRSARSLEDLSISPCAEEEVIRAVISFRHLVAKEGMGVDSAGSAMPVKAEDLKPEEADKMPPKTIACHHWTQLSILSLQGVICELKPFLAFFKLHKPTLRRVSLSQCAVRLTTRSLPLHHGAHHLDDAELSLEEKDKLNWTKVFRSLKSNEPVGKKFDRFSLMHLSAGTTGHIHMSYAEASLWRMYLEGRISDEPDWASLQDTFDDDDDAGVWCLECANDWEDEYDDGEEMDDEDMMGMHPFGHPEFIGDMWDDEHDGNIWMGGPPMPPHLPIAPSLGFLDYGYDSFIHGHSHHHHHHHHEDDDDDDEGEDEEDDDVDDDDDEMPPLA